jgi:hypothetical protein
VSEQLGLEQLRGMAEVFSATNGFACARTVLVQARATSSLPVPDSPVIRTATLERDRPADGAEDLLHRRRLA